MRTAVAGVALVLALVVLTRPVHACPACAGQGGTPGWWIAAVLAVPLVAGGLAALVIRRIVARGRR